MSPGSQKIRSIHQDHHHEENMTLEKVEYTAAEYHNLQNEFWNKVAESDGFDIEDIERPPCNNSMVSVVNCQQLRFLPYGILVKLYAKVGLHRYNMLKGTSFELDALVKFNFLANPVSSFYVTLLAHYPDPAASTLQKTFQVRIDEQKYGSLDLTVSIARPKDEVTTETPFIPHFHGGAAADGIFKGELPDWPSDDALNDGKRFYVVKESEWQATDWISMYLELVLCSHDRSITNNVVSQLEIVKVVIETAIEDVEPLCERLKAKSANVYIMFKGLAEPRAPRRVFETGAHVERKAIVRRVMGPTGYLTLVGKLCGGQFIKKRPLVLKSCKKRARIG